MRCSGQNLTEMSPILVTKEIEEEAGEGSVKETTQEVVYGGSRELQSKLEHWLTKWTTKLQEMR